MSDESVSDLSTPRRTTVSVDPRALERRWSALSAAFEDRYHASIRPPTLSSGIGSVSGLRLSEGDGDSTPIPCLSEAPRFAIECELGKGGMGVVSKGAQTCFGRTIAVKTVKPGSEADVVSLFIGEAMTTAHLDHPHIVPVYDLTRDTDPQLAMKLIDGTTWTTILHPTEEERHPQGGDDLIRHLDILIIVCQAIVYAHSKGVAHLDLKPDNVMIGHFGEVYVMDWGLAVAIAGPPFLARRKETVNDHPCGTILYMAPELADGRGDDIGPWTDVYILGAILCEILTGRPPHTGRDFMTIIADASRGPPPTFDESVPAELQRICHRALAKDHRERYETVEAFRDTLRGFLRHRESTIIADRASAMLTGTPTYADFAAAIAGFENALVLWAENPSAHTGLRAGRLAYARTALAAGDLGLAETQIALVSDHNADILALRHAIIAAYDTRHRADRNARRMRNGLIGMTVTLVLGLIVGITVVSRERTRAEQHLAEVLQLSDVKRARELEEQSEQLWPRTPDIVPELTRWIDAARGLAARCPMHRATLAHLTDPTIADDESRAWQREVMTELVARITRLTDPSDADGTIAEVASRLPVAQTIAHDSIEHHAAAWAEAIAAIRTSPLYHGLILVPQLGLVPIRQDPDTALWEFAHLETGDVPLRNGDGRLVMRETSGIVFVLLPEATFAMGAELPSDHRELGGPNCDPDAQEDDEAPVHTVSLAPFFLSKYEMTQGQWMRFTRANPSALQTSLLEPVEHVSWEECARILSRLGLALPTEAQWEYAARAGTTTPWPTGDDPTTLEGFANLADRYCKEDNGPPDAAYEEWLDDGARMHAPIGTYAANRFGFHEIIGNVGEWCCDALISYAWPVDPRTGERHAGEVHGDDSGDRVTRGGSFADLAVTARVSYRMSFAPSFHESGFGVRPARAIRD